MKIQELTIKSAQHGIIFNAWVSIPTRRQYTNEMHDFVFRYAGKSTVLGLIRFRFAVVRFGRKVQSESVGEHDLSPTNFGPGLFGS